MAHFDLGKALGASERDNSDPQTHLEAALRLASLALAPGSFKLGEIQLELAMHYESVGALDLAVARIRAELAQGAQLLPFNSESHPIPVQESFSLTE